VRARPAIRIKDRRDAPEFLQITEGFQPERIGYRARPAWSRIHRQRRQTNVRIIERRHKVAGASTRRDGKWQMKLLAQQATR
jgi:hypothetical protein